MTAADLEALAERLMLGEYTTADLHAAARCARGWAKVEKMRGAKLHLNQATSTLYYPPYGDYVNSPTAMEAVEAAEVGK